MAKALRQIDDEVLERPFDKKQFGRLLKYLLPYKKRIIGALILMVTATACSLGSTFLLSRAISDLQANDSSIIGYLLGGMVGGLLCIAAVAAGFGDHLPNMIIGTIIALVPGVPFTNGMRDLANEDYIAGATRLMDAFLTFLCIALGVALAFIAESLFGGGIMQLGAPVRDAVAAAWYIQLPAAFVGTVGFSALFGAPRRHYADCGVAGMLGWAMYLLGCGPWLSLSVAGAAFLGALVVAVASAVLAVVRRCPTTVFLICGIIPLVPGGGIFWTAYYLVSNHLLQAATMGFTALKVTIAIAGGIILAGALAARFQKMRRK